MNIDKVLSTYGYQRSEKEAWINETAGIADVSFEPVHAPEIKLAFKQTPLVFKIWMRQPDEEDFWIFCIETIPLGGAPLDAVLQYALTALVRSKASAAVALRTTS